MQNVGGTKLNETGIRHGFFPQGASGGVRGIKLYTASGLNVIKWNKVCGYSVVTVEGMGGAF